MTILDLLNSIGVVVARCAKRLESQFVCQPGVKELGCKDRTTYEVTGMSPQSSTFPQKLNGLSAKGLNLD